MEQLHDHVPHLVGNAAPSRHGAHAPAARVTDSTGAVAVSVPLLSLRPADSPRLNGEDKAHIARLAQTETPLPPKSDNVVLKQGDRVRLETSGGGGFGPPAQRNEATLARDVALGYVSPQAAREVFGAS